MGFLSFSRSVRFGPLRVNLSKSGIGLSAGVRGARVSVGPRGTYVTLGRGGFRYRQKLSGSRGWEENDVESGPSFGVAEATDDGRIATASVDSLRESSPNDSLAEIQRRITKFSWFGPFAVLGVAGLLALVSLVPARLQLLAAALVGLPLAIGGFFVYRWNRERRTARVFYDVDNESLVERLALCNAVGETLAKATHTWHIYSQQAINDRKRNAGANTLIKRTRVHCVNNAFELFETNIQPWSIPVGPQRLMFLPDRLLVSEGKQFAGIPYDLLSAAHEAINFIEADALPPDGDQVGTTWQYVNKSGGPDRRFNDNRQLPVMKYGELTLSSPSGLTILFNSSQAEASKRAAELLKRLAATPASFALVEPRASRPVHEAREEGGISEPLVANPVTTTPVTTTPVTASPRQVANAVAVVLRFIAVADRRITEDEVQFATKALEEFCANDDALLAELGSQFRKMKSDDGALAQAVELLRTNAPVTMPRVLTLTQQLAHADGKVTPKENERLETLRNLLA